MLVVLLKLLHECLIRIKIGKFLLIHGDGNLGMMRLIILLIKVGNLFFELLDLRIFARPHILKLFMHLVLLITDKGKFGLEICHAVQVLSGHHIATLHSLFQSANLLLELADNLVFLGKLGLRCFVFFLDFYHFNLKLMTAIFRLLQLLNDTIFEASMFHK